MSKNPLKPVLVAGSQDSAADSEELYRIGTVAQLTGIAVERLRAWERRYGLAPSQKSGKTRFYSTEQVRWLQSVKALIDLGQPISSLINLSQSQLDSRLGSRPTAEPDQAALTVDLIGTGLLLAAQQQENTLPFSVAGSATTIDQWLARLDQLGQAAAADVVAVQLMTLDLPRLLQLRDALEDTPLLLLYEYATDAQLTTLTEEGFELQRWPLTMEALSQQFDRLTGRVQVVRSRAARRFSDEELIALGATPGHEGLLSGHLVRMINDLNGYTEFVDANQRTAIETSRRPPLAAPGHEHLTNHVSQARALLETALEQLQQGSAS